MNEWLDTQTRALLQRIPSARGVAVDTGAYSLLLLEKGTDGPRIEEAVSAIRTEAASCPHDWPFVVGQQLSLENAFVGQFALACCDCAAAFLPDDVLEAADGGFLRKFYHQVMNTPDFHRVPVRLWSIPRTGAGRRFCWQFLGLATGVPVPTTLHTTCLKAELMEHWAHKMGVELELLWRD